MNIVILESMAVNPGDLSWDAFSRFGDVTIYPRLADPEETVRRIQNADIVLLNKTPVNAALLDRCPRLKLVCVLATGYNVIDCGAAAQRGVVVCNVPAYGTTAVAQFTFGLLLEVCHQIGHHDRLVHEGRWSHCPDFCFWDTPQMELAGKTLGIIGYGRIGQAVGKIAEAFGMKVLSYSRRGGFPNSVCLDTLLAQSDIVSLHCPLTPETTKLINRDTIAKMKDGAIVLNTSRGAAVDEEALAEALKSGKLRAAAVDVAAVEPIPETSPLLTAPNCIITPHMAWAPKESRQRILDTTMDSIQAFLEGTPVNQVN